MASRQYLPTPEKEMIVRAVENGQRPRAVAELFGCDKRTVTRFVAKAKAGKTLHRASKSGRRPITTQKEDRMLARAHMQNPNLTSTDGVSMIKRLSNKDISRWTVNRRLIRAGLFARRPAKKPLMVARHRKLRLEFAKKYANWTSKDWARVIFIDETKVNLFYPDGNHMIRRPIGKRYHLKYLRPTVKFGGGSIMLWGK